MPEMSYNNVSFNASETVHLIHTNSYFILVGSLKGSKWEELTFGKP